MRNDWQMKLLSLIFFGNWTSNSFLVQTSVILEPFFQLILWMNWKISKVNNYSNNRYLECFNMGKTDSFALELCLERPNN